MASRSPFAPLSHDEIESAVKILKASQSPAASFQFKMVTLHEPAKTEVLAFLAASDDTRPEIDRRAYMTYYLRGTSIFFEVVVNITQGKVDRHDRLGPNLHGAADVAEMEAAEKAVLSEPSVRAALKDIGLPEDAPLVGEPFPYGADGVDDDDRMWQFYLYTRDPNNLDANHYAQPLPVSPVFRAMDFKVVRIDHLPLGFDTAVDPKAPYEVPPPNEYLPECQPNLRKDVKPLRVLQPEGTSFTIKEDGDTTGKFIEWQKWSLYVGFNQQEGVVLYNIKYDGRDLFYRVALSEMNIPYADPRAPYHRKSAFDLADGGAGLLANNLRLGCDCLGSIYYMNGLLADDSGSPMEMPNVVCIHEQDAGIGWKHTNFRTGNACVVRSRELVLQTILTVGNYEYILAFIFNQAAELSYEVRATGILSTQPIGRDVTVDWGTVVNPGVLAAHHQHVFSLRVDPAIDGHTNRVAYDEAYALPRSDMNKFGTGYVAKETLVETSGGLDLDWSKNRVFKIQNASHRNPVNKKPVAYKIQLPPYQFILADEESLNFKRCEFADHSMYVTSYRDGELYACGRFTNQSRGGYGVRTMAARKDDVVDKDIVVWVNFGINHIPRIEDFPVMPCETIRVNFKPVNFFVKNPALDVPPSTQEVNKSALVTGQDGPAAACCS
ncbi:Copper amine oxidase 1 [Zalerion maritima]|uniref:Amine oxidase n=1 Tax=Zalerion maritima TaxID=339359 RepID=A0AAD5WNJ6_9PEZI|nr:Copper amine oxidase 1 [Zalerion maritima]